MTTSTTPVAASGAAEAEAGSPTVFLDAIRRHARTRPDRIAATFVDYSTDRHGVRRSLTYREFDEQARAAAARLRAVTRPGDRVAVLCPQSLEYLVSMVACLYADTLAVPLYAPEAYRSNQRLEAVMADCRASAALTTEALYQAVTETVGVNADGEKIHILSVDEPSGPVAELPPSENPSEIAYLQYTSGSTRVPAGVQVTHANIAKGVVQLATSFTMEEDSVVVSWLPFFHDMGLVLTALTPLFLGASSVYISPYAFVQNPMRWLRLATEFRGTHMAGPNFGLDLCVDRVNEEMRKELDLSNLVALVNGAEPVRAQTMRRFSDAFAGAGFRHEAHTPAYGLAEATLIVSGSRVGRGPLVPAFDRRQLEEGRAVVVAEGPDAQLLVSNGDASDQEIRIVDPARRVALPDAVVGEIWLHGENVCTGYWDKPELSSEVFDGRLPDEPEDRRAGWLNTGDLGFMLDGELYIAGRTKDLIIVDGRNHYPADIELTAEAATPALRRGHVLAFGVSDDKTEKLVIVAEVDKKHSAGLDMADVVRAVRAAVNDAHEIETAEVALIRQGTAPKTTSGKLQRRLCRQQYETGRLTPYAP